jgi:hypothetical protein
MSVVRVAVVVAAVGCLSALGGCVAAVVAGGCAGVAYVNGASVIDVEGDPQVVRAAAEQAFLQLGFAVISSDGRPDEAEIVARTGKDEKIRVVITREGCNVSKVAVRARTFGDRCLQNRVLSQITQNLHGSPASPAAPVAPAPPDAPASESRAAGQ